MNAHSTSAIQVISWRCFYPLSALVVKDFQKQRSPLRFDVLTTQASFKDWSRVSSSGEFFRQTIQTLVPYSQAGFLIRTRLIWTLWLKFFSSMWKSYGYGHVADRFEGFCNQSRRLRGMRLCNPATSPYNRRLQTFCRPS